MHKGSVYIGTSGWMYKDWGEAFYPPGMKKGFLSYLAQEFPTVEVNSSFYHLPLASTFAKWREEVPESFVFSVKLSRYVTHRNLPSVRQPVYRFLSRAKRLQEKLGPVLVQFPPHKKFSEAWFEKFLEDLAAAAKRAGVHPRFAIEPRHESWLAALPKVRALLRKAHIALVFPHSSRIPSVPPEDENLTADFVYVRFHGPSEFGASSYGSRRLAPWATRIRRWRDQGKDVFCYFNNDQHGYAVEDARTLRRLVRE
ncbi:MAG TPA: DUF72 domain-containing protein [Candidatus Paceibacterota bacterium]